LRRIVALQVKVGSSVLGRRDSYIIKSTGTVLSRKKFNHHIIKRAYSNLKEAAKSARDKTGLDTIQEMANELAIKLRKTKFQELSDHWFFEVGEAIRKRDDELRTVYDAKSGHAGIPGLGEGGFGKEKKRVPPRDYLSKTEEEKLL